MHLGHGRWLRSVLPPAGAILANAPVGIDMILMDVDAPEENGFVFGAWVRANYPTVEMVLAGSIERTVT